MKSIICSLEGERLTFVKFFNRGELMYFIWKQWHEDINLDCEITKMILKRKDKRIELYHLNHIMIQQENILAQTKSNLYNTKLEYEEIDLELSLIDGRFSYIKLEPKRKKPVKKSKERITKVVANLGPEEKKALIEELLKMK